MGLKYKLEIFSNSGNVIPITRNLVSERNFSFEGNLIQTNQVLHSLAFIQSGEILRDSVTIQVQSENRTRSTKLSVYNVSR